jgi:hypothetical protein
VHPGTGAFLCLNTVSRKMRVPDDTPTYGVHDEDHRQASRLRNSCERVSWPNPHGSQLRYEWMPGRFFLLQHVELTQYGQRTTGLEVIGHLRPFGELPSGDIHSRFYDSAGNTLDYVFELNGDTLIIWPGRRVAPPITGASSTSTTRPSPVTASSLAVAATAQP